MARDDKNGIRHYYSVMKGKDWGIKILMLHSLMFQR